MGLYATLLNASVPCPRCQAPCVSDWQFYFGSISELPHYSVGDAIDWTGPSRYGEPSMTHVDAVAYPDSDLMCTACQFPYFLGQVAIRDGIIVGLEFLVQAYSIPECVYEGPFRKPLYDADLLHNSAHRPQPRFDGDG